jgi:hypothetical protein
VIIVLGVKTAQHPEFLPSVLFSETDPHPKSRRKPRGRDCCCSGIPATLDEFYHYVCDAPHILALLHLPAFSPL